MYHQTDNKNSISGENLMAHANRLHLPINQQLQICSLRKTAFQKVLSTVGFMGRQILYFLVMLNLGKLLNFFN